jgi:hypothetical protein
MTQRETVAWLMPNCEAINPRAPTGPLPCFTDTVVNRWATQSRLILRGARPAIGPRTRRDLLRCRGAPAVDPEPHRRDTHATPLRGLPAAHCALQAQLHQLDSLPSGQPPTLALHPG